MTDTKNARWKAAVEKANLPCHCDQHLRAAGLPRPGTGKFGWSPSAVSVKGAVKKRSLKAQADAVDAMSDGDELVKAAAELGINLDELSAA